MRRIIPWVLLGSCCCAGPVLGSSLAIAPPATTALAIAHLPLANGLNATTNLQPATIKQTIWVEGEPETVILDRVVSAVAPVSTYVVRGSFISESDVADGLATMRFVANGGDVRNDLAYVSVIAPKAGAISAQQLWQRYTGPRGWLSLIGASTVTDAGPHHALQHLSWAKAARSFRRMVEGELIVGELYLGEMQGQSFVVIVHLPAEYTEGYGPRVGLLLRYLQWQPSQRPPAPG